MSRWDWPIRFLFFCLIRISSLYMTFQSLANFNYFLRNNEIDSTFFLKKNTTCTSSSCTLAYWVLSAWWKLSTHPTTDNPKFLLQQLVKSLVTPSLTCCPSCSVLLLRCLWCSVYSFCTSFCIAAYSFAFLFFLFHRQGFALFFFCSTVCLSRSSALLLFLFFPSVLCFSLPALTLPLCMS